MKPFDAGFQPAASLSGRDPNGSDYAPDSSPGGSDVSELASRLRADQWQRWQGGSNVTAEEYLAEFPALRSSAECAIDLIYSEFLVREELGQQPDPAEYLDRFPEFRVQLRRQFALHSELDAAASEAGTASTVHDVPGPGEPDTPDRIGRFVIRERLGIGGFGSVYRAYDPQLAREVALKVPHPHLLTEGHRERFLREARAAAQLRHANLVAVYDSGASAAGCFIAYQLVPGQSLAQALQKRSFTPSETAQLICKLAQAADHAHSQGIFHRDLKTANVLLDETGEPYISDFGLVRFEGEATLTTEAAVLGTPAYMPPEQAAGASHQADARSDVYTLGIVMYELLTGRLPFSGSPQSVLRQVLDEDPLPVRALNRDVARDLETICLKAMSKRPSDRYDTARFMAEDLSRWLQHEPIRAKPVGTTVRLWKWARRRPAAAALVGVIAVAIVSVFVVGAWYNLRLRAAHVESQRLLAQAKQMLSQAQAERGVQLLESGDPAGLLHLAEARGTAEGNRQVSESRALLWAGWYDACAGRLLQVGGDDAPIHTAMFTQSDDRLITGSDLGVYLWDIASGARLGDRMPQIKHVPLAIDGTGELLATAPPDHAPQLWDTSTGASRAVQFPSIPKVTGLCLSRDGNLIAVASGSLVWIGEVATGQFFSEPLRHGGDVGQAMAFSADGTLLVTTSRLNELGVARVWRIHRSSLSIESLGRPLIHDQEIAAVAFTPERATPVRLVTASRDGTARLWDPFTGGVVGDPMRHRDGVSVVAFSPDGSRVATGSFDGTARIWNPKTGRAMTELMRHQGPVRALQFSCNGSLLATGSLDGLVRIWNASNGSMQGWPLRHFGDVTSVSFSHDDRMLASASGGGFVRIWSVVQPAVEAARIFSHSSRVYSLALSRGTGQLMVTGAGDGSVQLWDSDSGSAIHEAWRYTGEMSCVAISPEEDVVACGPCGAGRNRIEFRDTATGRVLGDQLPIRGAVQSLAYSPDGKMLATGSANGTLQIWDTVGDRRRGRIVRYSEEPSILPIASLAFSPDQKLLAFGSEDRTVRLWDFNSMQLHCSPLWHDARVDAIAFSPDGKRLATASRGMAIRFWEIKGGQASVVQTIRSQANVQAMTFSPSGQLIATAAADGSVRLWDIATGLPCGRPFLHDATATAVSFTPDGEWLATASFDKTARIWRLPQHLGDSNLRLIHLRTVVALGAQLDSQGNVESVPWPEWQRLRKELGE